LTKQELALFAMDKSPNICYMADMENHQLIYLNEIGKKMHGITDDSYIGKKCYDVIQKKKEVCSFCTNDKLKEGEFYKWDFYNPIIDEYFELLDTMVKTDGRKVRIEIAMNVDQKAKYLKALEHKLTLEKTLLKCAQSLTGHSNIDVALDSLLKVIAEFYDADRVLIFEIKEGENLIGITYERVSEGLEKHMDKLQEIPIEVFADWFTSFIKNGEYGIASIVDEVDKDSALYKVLEPQGIESLLVAPLVISKKTIGFIGLDNPRRKFNDSSLLRSMALFAANDLDKKRLLIDLENLSYKDVFTGLFNRNKYKKTIEEILLDKITTVGIIFLDINELKQVNDINGHEQGDKLILAVVAKIKSCFSTNVFRIGGDEFVILYLHSSRAEFEKKALELRFTLLNDQKIGVSIGVTWSDYSYDIEKQITCTDELMYEDKRKFYSERRNRRNNFKPISSLKVEKDVSLDKFTLFLHPKISLSTGVIVGAEALVSKKGENRGFVCAETFISIYKFDGVILSLDLIILEKVCIMLKEWKEIGLPLLSVSVSFSCCSILEKEIGKKIANICKKYDIEPKLITIELAENISDISLISLAEIVEEIKSFDFKVALGDFGRGFSNLSILEKIHFDEVKLDNTLIKNIASNNGNKMALFHLCELCNSFRPTKLVAKGIETKEQFEILRDLKSKLDITQGPYFTHPLPVSDFLLYSKNKSNK